MRASIGVALDQVGDDVTADELLRDADTAMYRAKANGRGGLAVFEPSMLAHQLARLELDAELRYSHRARRAFVVYQPIVDLTTGDIAAVEALVRWDHPTRGMLAPTTSSTSARNPARSWRSVPWVVNEACRQARRGSCNAAARHLRVSVNTSAREVVEPPS